jgi:hypothetical protein
MLASGCLVSFNDYPTGDLRPEGGGSAAAGGGGGTIVSGGSGGSGGVNSAGSGGKSMLELMIDDFEDGNVTLLPAGERTGSWYMGNDNSFGGMQLPFQNTGLVDLLEPPRGSSERGLHTWGSGFDDWGAMVRADFNVQTGMAEPYDASAYTGVKLWARSNDLDTYRIRVQIPTPATDDNCFQCGDHFGTTVETTPDWSEFVVPFEQMAQEGFGTEVGQLELEQAIGVQLGFPRGEDFDVWIDDVSFY